MKGNDFVAFLLCSPLHGMLSGNTLLITVRGRKSGREITLPVNYIRIGSELWVLSSHERNWWRNVQGCADVRLRLRGRDLPAKAEVITSEAEVAEKLGEYVKRLPMAARGLGIRMENGVPNRDDLLRIARERLMVRLEPAAEAGAAH